VERAIGYARQSFWPLREFTDLYDVNRQARQWLCDVANQRLHRETRERPIDRFKAEALADPSPWLPWGDGMAGAWDPLEGLRGGVILTVHGNGPAGWNSIDRDRHAARASFRRQGIKRQGRILIGVLGGDPIGGANRVRQPELIVLRLLQTRSSIAQGKRRVV
jgi:hypothetical protein